MLYENCQDIPGGPVARTSPSNTGIQVQALLRELKSHKPHGQKNQNIKQKHYCNKFNKDFKNGVKKKKKRSPLAYVNWPLSTRLWK